MPKETNRNFANQAPIIIAATISYIQTNVFIGNLLLLYSISILGTIAYFLSLPWTITTGYEAISGPSLNTAISCYFTNPFHGEDYPDANGRYSNKVINLAFCQWSKKCVLSFSDNRKIIMLDTENSTSPIFVVQRVVQISSYGVA